MLYMDSSNNGEMYKCVKVSDTSYTWVKLVSEDGRENANGFPAAAAGLLITILRDCVTYGPQTANIDVLEALLMQGEEEPSEGVYQIGSVLTVISGVPATQDDDTLDIT